MKQTFKLSGIIFFMILFLGSCQNVEKKQVTEESKPETENKIDLSTQENFEKFLADWNITIPENSTLKDLKKTNDGNYKIIYSIEPFKNIQDSLQITYEKMFDEALLNKGWIKPKAGWDPHGTVYEKDDMYFKFFIVVSEKHNIYELAFKYGD